MSTRIRGQEVAIAIMVNGKRQGGSFTKIENFKITPRTDLSDSDFLGEKESEPDLQHHGFDFSFTTHEQDDGVINFLLQIVRREQLGQPHPTIDIIAIHKFRDPGMPAKTVALEKVTLKLDDHSFDGRKDYVKNTFSGKCKTMTPVGA